MNKIEFELDKKKCKFENGKLAKQADGSVLVQFGNSVVLVTAAFSEKESEMDFFPLTVDYRERAYSYGKIPGGYIKREGRSKDKEILTSRLIDRPIRPLFPKNYRQETQIIATVLAADKKIDPDILAINGASLALCLSSIPFMGPIGAVRIAIVKDEFIINPTYSEIEIADLSIVVAGNKERITMIEGNALEATEENILKAISYARKYIKILIEKQEELVEKAGKEKIELKEVKKLPEDLENIIIKKYKPIIVDVSNNSKSKKERSVTFKKLIADILEEYKEEYSEDEKLFVNIINNLWTNVWKDKLQKENIRPDGREPDQIRDISIETGVLPCVHGSALFTRGQTQALAVVTLGNPSEEQRLEEIEGDSTKSFMLHYNFPPFSVGEVRPMRGPGRRDIGHGTLAERALASLVPPEDIFPYTIRIVSEILESNGSSSMASVCAGSLSMMDAGIPVTNHVAGVSLGLVSARDEGEKDIVLIDIAGEEDHEGDMDLKIAGTLNGINSLQMDTKIEGITIELLREGFEKAKKGRIFILEKMKEILPKAREELSKNAPRMLTIQIPKDKIGGLIGPGGKNVRSIQDETSCVISIEEDGKVFITGENEETATKALNAVKNIVRDVELGEVYTGKVVKIADFGAFVEIFPGKEGLLHISEIDWKRTQKVEDVLKVGDLVKVECIKFDSKNGKISLSRKRLLPREKKKES